MANAPQDLNLIRLSALCHDKPSSVQFLQQRGILHTDRQCDGGHPMILRLRDDGKGDAWRCNVRNYRRGLLPSVETRASAALTEPC